MRRRVPGDVPSSITLNHGDLLVMGWFSAIGVCTSHGALGCMVLGLTLLAAGLHNTLRPVHLQAWWVVFLPTCAQGLAEPSSRRLGGVGK